MGHGISDYAVGIHDSTGFNKVGQPYKKPNDPDFRKGRVNFQNPWDMGPNVTLVLAVGFTFALIKATNKNKMSIMIMGAFAFCNSLIRLIPMIHSYLGLLIKGNFFDEDEIGTGLSWFNLSHLEIMKYIPSLISISVSVICLYYVLKALKLKLPNLVSKKINFTLICMSAYIISFIIESVLDKVIRINWI
jgi:hypothetical protein